MSRLSTRSGTVHPSDPRGDQLATLAREGLASWLMEHDVDAERYQARLETELAWFMARPEDSACMLALAGVVRFMRQAGIVHLPGCGGLSNLLTALALRLTEIDPIEHGLFAERGHPRNGYLLEPRLDLCALERATVVAFASAQRDEEEALARLSLSASPLCSIVGVAAHAAQIDQSELRFEPSAFRHLDPSGANDILLEPDHEHAALLVAAKPTSLLDVAAIMALARPSTKESDKAFVRARAGSAYSNAVVAENTAITRGVAVFREQVLSIIQRLTGMSAFDCDTIVRHVHHGDPQGRTDFVAAASTRVPREEAERTYDWVQGIAPQLFPKGHALAMAGMVCRAAFLRTHHRDAFEAAKREVQARLAASVIERG